jgi:hypothetical protein
MLQLGRVLRQTSPAQSHHSRVIFSPALSSSCSSFQCLPEFAGCAWTAQSNSPSFITITSGASGAGDGPVDFSVAANTSTDQRTGTLTIAGRTFTITQNGAAPVVSYTISGQVSLTGIGIGGVTVTLSGTLSASATTGADGRYSFANLTAGGNYTVTPANIGYIFEPLSRTVDASVWASAEV